MIRAIAIDDEPMPLNILTRYSQRTNKVNLKKTFTSTMVAKNWLIQNSVDLLFLDINMPALSGLDFFKSLKEDYMVIFTTAYSEYAVDGFNLNAIDYLLKPFSYERFIQAVGKAVDYYQFQSEKNPKEIFIKENRGIIKIPIREILFIEAYADYLKIHRADQKKIVTRMTMNNIAEILPQGFLRVHRSYIVSIERVEQLLNRQIFIEGHEIPIGKTYYKLVRSVLSEIIN